MKVIQLQTENIKNIKAIEINPDGTDVVITGRNGAGKSAMIDSIAMALTGKNLDDVIRLGQKKGSILVKLGESPNDVELIVKRVITEKGARLEITTPNDPKKKKTPQKILDAINGALCFDPLSFVNLDKNKQRNSLLQFIDFNFDEYKARRETSYDNRRIANRDIEKYKIEISSYGNLPDDTPLKTFSIEDKFSKLKSMNKIREYRDNKLDSLEECSRDILANEELISKCQENIKRLECEKIDIESSLKSIPEYTDEDIEKLEDEISDIDDVNSEINKAIERNRIKEKLAIAESCAQKYDDEIKALDNSKIEAVNNGKYPIANLSVNDDCVLYKNIPIKKLSSAEQVKVAVSIAMALNPTLRVLLIKEGSLLDDEMYNAIVDMATKNDFQVWIEKVFIGNGCGIYIEDGEIKDLPERIVDKN